MAITYIGDSTPDFGGNWATYGGATPNVDRNVSGRSEPWEVPVGGVVAVTLECGMACAPAQEGATVEMGLYNAADDSLIASATIQSRFDNDPAEYVWHPVSINVPLMSGVSVYMVRAKPTVAIYHTQSADAVTEVAEPSTETLSDPWVTTNFFGRRIPMRFGYEVPSNSATLTSPVRVGGDGYTGATSGMGAVTSITNGSITGTSTDAFEYSMDPFEDGVVYLPMGSQLFNVGDGSLVSITASIVQPMEGYSFVEIAAPVHTGEFSLGKNASFIAGVVVHWPTLAGVINPDTTLSNFVFGTYACWRRDIDGTMRAFTLTVNESGAYVGPPTNLKNISLTNRILRSQAL